LYMQQTLIQGTNSSHAVDLPVAQLDLDVFQTNRQLEPTVATNALIQRTTPLPLVQGQLVQILEGITGASLQETDFYATNMSNTQVLEVMQRATLVPQLLQHTNIPAADRQILLPLQSIDVLTPGFQLQAQEFREIGILTKQHIQVTNLIEALNGSLRTSPGPQASRTRKYGENKNFFQDQRPFFFNRNNNSVMSHTNLATTQRQIDIHSLSSGQNDVNVQGNLIEQQGVDLEGNQTQRQNTMARNSHIEMEIDMVSEGRDINPPPLEAKQTRPLLIDKETTGPRNLTF
ncbi:MAG: hypothetical protein EZS28_047447, partial [Streblomastix strix]